MPSEVAPGRGSSIALHLRRSSTGWRNHAPRAARQRPSTAARQPRKLSSRGGSVRSTIRRILRFPPQPPRLESPRHAAGVPNMTRGRGRRRESNRQWPNHSPTALGLKSGRQFQAPSRNRSFGDLERPRRELTATCYILITSVCFGSGPVRAGGPRSRTRGIRAFVASARAARRGASSRRSVAIQDRPNVCPGHSECRESGGGRPDGPRRRGVSFARRSESAPRSCTKGPPGIEPASPTRASPRWRPAPSLISRENDPAGVRSPRPCSHGRPRQARYPC